MKIIEFIFWLSLCGLFFIYVLYGPLIWLINRLNSSNKPAKQSTEALPELAIVIAAYNEESVIAQKLDNTLSLKYPKEKLRIYVVADGSDDRTVNIAKSYSGITLIWQAERNGKMAAINRAMQQVKEEITVFTDANVTLAEDALVELVKHYHDQATGAVSGEKRVLSESGNAAATEGLYWRYESFLKKEDAQLSSLMGAAGEFFSLRTKLFRAQAVDTLLDDFMLSMDIIAQGYRIAYEPAAIASEPPSKDLKAEFQRKIRIGAGGIQSVFRTLFMLNPFRFGIKSLQYVLHRLSRWVLAPLFIPAMLVSNIFLLNTNGIYIFLFAGQLIFHLSAYAAWHFQSRGKQFKALSIPFYFNFMHLCILVGWYRFASGKQSVKWQKAERNL